SIPSLLATSLFYKFIIYINKLTKAKNNLRLYVAGLIQEKRRFNGAVFMAACVPRFRYIRRTNPYG
ncbi:hypothetical protein, partial [Pseudomonas lactis]|uniref:hypothetical protein n=1 Tax=Pseudomonas lactis TaxID=1615674 RepID=UPI001F1F0000